MAQPQDRAAAEPPAEEQHADTVTVVEPDPDWPRLFQREAHRISAALGRSALRIEHVGSTAVPGLPAKPVIDVLLVVADAADEPAYVPALEGAGYELRLREPDWFEHRLLRGPDTACNLHVFPDGAEEIERMVAFRDHLRRDAADRERYASAKQELARHRWRCVQDYADAKGPVVEEIRSRIGAR